MLNALAGFALAVALLVVPRRLLWSVAALLLSTTVGLFGFVESTAAPLWWGTFWIEAAAAVVLTVLALVARRRPA
ncbi:hypothetical protein [Blastococcus sp. SYSU DS0973]